MSGRSEHPTLGHLPGPGLTRSASTTANTSPTDPPVGSTPQRSPFGLSGGALSSASKMANSTRSGAGSPSHELGAGRLFSKRAREIQAQEGVVSVWGPPTSGNSPLCENIPESPTDGFPDFSHIPLSESVPSTTKRARAGTVPSRFSPGGVSSPSSPLPGMIPKSSRPSPSPGFLKSPSPIPGDVDNSPAALLSRLRAGSMPQRPQFASQPGPFGPSVFSTNWSSGRERTSTLASIASQGSNGPSSPTQSAFSREGNGENDMQMRTLDYLGLADTPQPPRAQLVNPLLANLADINKQANRFRSYSVNAKEKYAEDEDGEYGSANLTPGNLTPYEAQAQLQMQIAATHAAIAQHNLAVQAYANQASANRPRARTAGVLESPTSRLLKHYYPTGSRLDSNMNSVEMNEEYDELPDAVTAMSLGRSNSRNDHHLNPDDNLEGPTRALWLGGIPSCITASTLMEKFKDHGRVTYARVLTHKNCGFVNFEHVDSAISAKGILNGTEIFGGSGPVRINFAKPSSPSVTPGPEGHAPDGHAPSLSPDPFLRAESNGEASGTSPGPISRPGTAPLILPALAEMKSDIMRIVLEFGATPDDKVKINRNLDASIAYTGFQSEIPSIPEPASFRTHDAQKLREIRKGIDTQSLSVVEIEEVATGMLRDKGKPGEIAELSSDYLGNTVVQKLFEHCSDEKRDQMLEEIAPHMSEIGVHKNGTWAAQKIIDVCKTPKQMLMIVNNLKPYTVPLFLDQYGNYVLQCCLKFGSPFNDFIFESMLSQMWEIAQGRYGARAMRACLESHHSTKEQQRMIAAAIALHSVQLATNANGALLLTWFLDTCTFPKRRSVLAPRLVPHLVHLCTHKVAYLTVLKIINQKLELDARDVILEALFFSPQHQTLEAILSDHACGATLIYKVLTTPFFDGKKRSDAAQNVSNVLLKLKAQPAQGYKRLMDEVGLSTRGVSNGSSRDVAPSNSAERPRPGSNHSQASSHMPPPQFSNNQYYAQMPPSPYEMALQRTDSMESNISPFPSYAPLYTSNANVPITPIGIPPIHFQNQMLGRAAPPVNNFYPSMQSGFGGFSSGSPAPDHFRNQPQANVGQGVFAPPGFGAGVSSYGYPAVSPIGIGYGMQQEQQVNGRGRRR